MSDFFTQLERHLVTAANDPPRRFRPPRASAVLTVAAATAMIAAVAVLAPRLLAPADERPVTSGGDPVLLVPDLDLRPPTGAALEPDQARPATGCEIAAGEPAPAELVRSLAVLRRPAEAQPPLSAELAALGPYPGAARLARAEHGREYWVVPVISSMVDRGCDGGGGGPLFPGACLYLVEDGPGPILLCARTEAIARGIEFVARPLPRADGTLWELAGIVPDGVASVEFDRAHTFGARNNVVIAHVRGTELPFDGPGRPLDAAGRPFEPAG